MKSSMVPGEENSVLGAKSSRMKNARRVRQRRHKEDEGLKAFWRMDVTSTTPDLE